MAPLSTGTMVGLLKSAKFSELCSSANQHFKGEWALDDLRSCETTKWELLLETFINRVDFLRIFFVDMIIILLYLKLKTVRLKCMRGGEIYVLIFLRAIESNENLYRSLLEPRTSLRTFRFNKGFLLTCGVLIDRRSSIKYVKRFSKIGHCIDVNTWVKEWYHWKVYVNLIVRRTL